MSSDTDGPAATAPKRAVGLDALRGLAIVAMMAADNMPWSGLPAWMYHGQEPPPSHEYNGQVTGITWVDLVFPFFLFSMGAAIPLAQSRRDQDRPAWQNGALTLFRGLLLAAFAIFNQHVRPDSLSKTPGVPEWEIGILGFGLALAMFGRVPSRWPAWISVAIKVVGWGGAYLLIRQLHYPEHGMPTFNKSRSDVIILVLATVSVFGAYAWRLTRWSFEVRAAVIAALLAFRISAAVPGSWESTVWNWEAWAWLFRPMFLGYLLIVLPGSIAGDLLAKKEDEPVVDRWLGVACLTVIPVSVAVFFLHLNPMIAAGFGAVALLLFRDQVQGPYRAILLWGLLWLVLGCLFEPFEGGIKKDPYTISYLFAASGLASFGLVGFAQFPLRLFASVGQNPLLAYQAVTVLFPGLWPLVFARPLSFLPDSGWAGLSATCLQTALLVVLVMGFSRFRVTMRV